MANPAYLTGLRLARRGMEARASHITSLPPVVYAGVEAAVQDLGDVVAEQRECYDDEEDPLHEKIVVVQHRLVQALAHAVYREQGLQDHRAGYDAAEAQGEHADELGHYVAGHVPVDQVLLADSVGPADGDEELVGDLAGHAADDDEIGDEDQEGQDGDGEDHVVQYVADVLDREVDADGRQMPEGKPAEMIAEHQDEGHSDKERRRRMDDQGHGYSRLADDVVPQPDPDAGDQGDPGPYKQRREQYYRGPHEHLGDYLRHGGPDGGGIAEVEREDGYQVVYELLEQAAVQAELVVHPVDDVLGQGVVVHPQYVLDGVPRHHAGDDEAYEYDNEERQDVPQGLSDHVASVHDGEGARGPRP